MATGANFSRIKSWIKERLLFADLNAEFNNILTNFNPDGMGVGGSSDVLANMQASTNPAPYSGGVQTPSLPSSLTGELRRIRYILSVLSGQTYWYNDPVRSLVAVGDDLVAYLPFDPGIGSGLSAGNPTDAFGDTIRRGAIINAASLSAADVATTMFNSVNKFAGLYSFSLGAANILAIAARAKLQGSLTCQFRNLAAGDYVAYNPLLGIEVYLDGAGFLTAKLTQKTAANQTTAVGVKNSSTVAGATSRAVITAFHAMALRWDTGNGGTDSIGLFYDGVAEGAQISLATIAQNVGDGGVWFIGCKRQDPAWSHLSVMAGDPSTEANDPWTKVDAAIQMGVAAGILTIGATGTNITTFSNVNNIDLTQQTVENKCQLAASNGDNSQLIVGRVSDNALNRFFSVRLVAGRVQFSQDNVTFADVAFVDTSQYHVYRMTSSGAVSPTFKLYIDGKLVFTTTLTSAFDLGSNSIMFGQLNNGLAGTLTANFEVVGYSNASATAPIVGSTQGQIDDVGVMKNSIATGIITQLVNNTIKTVYGRDFYQGINLPSDVNFSSAVVTSGELTDSKLYVPSDGESELAATIVGTMTNSGAPLVGGQLLVDSIYPVASIGSITKSTQIALAARRRLPVGLRTISISVNEGASFGDTVGCTGVVSVARG